MKMNELPEATQEEIKRMSKYMYCTCCECSALKSGVAKLDSGPQVLSSTISLIMSKHEL